MLLGVKMKLYVLRLVVQLSNEVSTSAFNMLDSETNLLKFI
jgi:hypothetical protein